MTYEMPQLKPDDCLEYGHPCDAHAAHIWDRYDSRDSIARWAHSDLPPNGWSPVDAGERWDDDY
jgi:hypothetical protein